MALALGILAAWGGEVRLVDVLNRRLADEGELPGRPMFVHTLPESVPAYKRRVPCVETDVVLMDTVSINFHDYGTKVVYRWEGDFEELNAAVELGAKYIRTSKPDAALAGLDEIVARRTRPLKANEFRVRDPFILADAKTGLYYLYETTSPYLGAPYARGVSCRTSKDLVTWSTLRRIQSVPVGFKAKTVWAPEIHRTGNGYRLYSSVAKHPDGPNRMKFRPIRKGEVFPDWWFTNQRGVWIYHAESPLGPFTPVSDNQITPLDWLAIDGTPWEEDGRRYMVFSHEGIQTGNGEMVLGEISPDERSFVGELTVLFRARDVKGGSDVVDGPFLYRSKGGKLFMTWSNYVKGHGYCVILTESATGRIRGPWINQHIVYGENGGHGMLFSTFEGKLKFALHYPERRGWEHLCLLDVEDTGDDLRLTISR